MGLIGSAVGGVAGIAGGIFAGNALNKGFEQQQKMYEQRLSDIKAHRDKVYYQDPTQSAENQAAVTQARELLAERSDIKCIFPPLKLCGDNGAMIAGVAYHFLKRGDRSDWETTACARIPQFKRGLANLEAFGRR